MGELKDESSQHPTEWAQAVKAAQRLPSLTTVETIDAFAGAGVFQDVQAQAAELSLAVAQWADATMLQQKMMHEQPTYDIAKAAVRRGSVPTLEWRLLADVVKYAATPLDSCAEFSLAFWAQLATCLHR